MATRKEQYALVTYGKLKSVKQTRSLLKKMFAVDMRNQSAIPCKQGILEWDINFKAKMTDTGVALVSV